MLHSGRRPRRNHARLLVERIAGDPGGHRTLEGELGDCQGHLPDEVLELYKRGDYAHPVHKLEGKLGSITDPRLVEVSAQNEGKFDIDENGTVIDAKTRVRPPVIIGWPFPKIDPKDPKAGAKAMWNQIFEVERITRYGK